MTLESPPDQGVEGNVHPLPRLGRGLKEWYEVLGGDVPCMLKGTTAGREVTLVAHQHHRNLTINQSEPFSLVSSIV